MWEKKEFVHSGGRLPIGGKKMSKKAEELVPVEEDLETTLPSLASGVDPRWHSFLVEFARGATIHDAAITAGFSESYAKAGIYSTIKNGKAFEKALHSISDKAPATLRRISQLQALRALPELNELALEQYRKNPEKLLDRPAFLKTFKQEVGLIQDEALVPATPQININELRMLIIKGIPDTE